MKEIKTDKAPAAIGPYSQAIVYGNLLFTSGQIPVDPQSGTIPEGISAQAEQAFSNLKNLLVSAGSSTEKVLKTTLFIVNMDDFPIVNEIYSTFFCEPYPARSCVEVSKLPKGVLLEIEAVAEI